MTDETLDLGQAAREMSDAAKRRPCSGECGKSWDEAGGGWIYFGEPPRWYCSGCDVAINGPITGGPKEES